MKLMEFLYSRLLFFGAGGQYIYNESNRQKNNNNNQKFFFAKFLALALQPSECVFSHIMDICYVVYIACKLGPLNVLGEGYQN